jgi:hypothetical protein
MGGSASREKGRRVMPGREKASVEKCPGGQGKEAAWLMASRPAGEKKEGAGKAEEHVRELKRKTTPGTFDSSDERKTILQETKEANEVSKPDVITNRNTMAKRSYGYGYGFPSGSSGPPSTSSWTNWSDEVDYEERKNGGWGATPANRGGYDARERIRGGQRGRPSKRARSAGPQGLVPEGFGHLLPFTPPMKKEEPEEKKQEVNGGNYGAVPKKMEGAEKPKKAPKRGLAMPMPTHMYEEVPRGRADHVSVVVNPEGYRMVWNHTMAERVRQTLMIEQGRRAERAMKNLKSGNWAEPPEFGETYDANDHTHVRIDIHDAKTKEWVATTLERNMNLTVVGVGELKLYWTWYSCFIKHDEIMQPGVGRLRRIVAYQNKIDIEDIAVGEGDLNGRRRTDDNKGYVVFIGLSKRGRAKARRKRYILSFGACGYARIYPLEEGDEGPDDLLEETVDNGAGEVVMEEEEEVEDNLDEDLLLANAPALEGVMSEEEEPLGGGGEEPAKSVKGKGIGKNSKGTTTRSQAKKN